MLRTAVPIPLQEERTPPPVDALATGSPGGTLGARIPPSLPQDAEGPWLPQLLKPHLLSKDQKAKLSQCCCHCHFQRHFRTSLLCSYHLRAPAIGKHQQELTWQGNLDNAACKLPAPCTMAKCMKGWSRERQTVLGNLLCGDVCVLSNRCVCVCMCMCTHVCMHVCLQL